MEKVNDKIKANATSSYFMIFISGLFLFNKNNININNYFVRNHTKTAFLIHLLFLLNYIIFIYAGFLEQFNFFNYSLNDIIGIIIFLILFILLLYGAYKSNKGELFTISDIEKISKTDKIIDINGDLKLDEKDKLTLILAYIPFFGNIIFGKNYKNEILKRINKLNFISTLIILLLYIFGNYSIANIFLLFYLIFSVFSSIKIIAYSEIISLKLNFIYDIKEIELYIKSLNIYLYNYFKEKEFKSIKNIIYEEKEKQILDENNLLKTSLLSENNKSDLINKWLIYFPFINLIFLFKLNSKYRFHIINGITITIFIIIIWLFGIFGIINQKVILLFLFPIFYGIGYIKTRPYYKMPIIYSSYEILINFLKKTYSLYKLTIKKHNEDNIGSFKVNNISKMENDNEIRFN